MIVYASAASDWTKDSKYAAQWEAHAYPGIMRQEKAPWWYCVTDKDSIFTAYNEAIRWARECEAEALVLLHPDLELEDPKFGERCAAIFKAEPDVGMIGVIGGRKFDSLAWWQSEPRFGYQNLKPEDGRVFFTEGSDNDVDIVDGSVIVLSPSVLEWFQFDAAYFGPKSWHGYGEVIAAELKARGMKVRQIDSATRHWTTPGTYAGGKEDWDRIDGLFRRRYGPILMSRKGRA